jgi:intracellular multiplication protein IcmP
VRQTSNPRVDDMGIVYLAVAAAAALAAWYVWSTWHELIAYYGLLWTWQLLGLVDLPWMPRAIAIWRSDAAKLAAVPGSVTLGELVSAMNTAGYVFVAFPILLALRTVRIATRHRANLTRRRIDASTLPWIMAKHAPAVIPALYYGAQDTQLLNVDPEEHRSAANPEEWVARNGLLVNGALDRASCRDLLVKDLGEPISSLSELKAPERALFAVFGARLFADGADGAAAQQLLDELNRSCHTHTYNGMRGYPDLSVSEGAFQKHSSHPAAAAWLAKHRYPRTLLHAMHKQASQSGALASSHFRWLKGVDRGLWYALNTTGRKVPFMESAAVFTQTLWEDFAHDCGYQLTEPCVDDAIVGLESYLIKIGLMQPPQKEPT